MVADFLERVVHGGMGKRTQEKTRKTVLDFSASINPFPPQIAWNCDPLEIGRYPDDSYCLLKETIARSYNRDPGEICVGNGSIELIRVFCSVIFRNKERNKFFLTRPTFGEYELSANLTGATMADNSSDADVHFVCNPNNPTGTISSKETLLQLLENEEAQEGVVFCDEAFIDLADPRQSLSDIGRPGLFVLQSITKSFAVPGLRFGYGFADPELVEKMEITRPPWCVNAYAEAFAREAVLHRKDLERSRRLIAREREWLSQELYRTGLSPCPSTANFILVEHTKPVEHLCNMLENSDILVRDCASFGLPNYIRVAVRTREENRILIEAIGSCLH